MADVVMIARWLNRGLTGRRESGLNLQPTPAHSAKG
jgi:hypothetical protein